MGFLNNLFGGQGGQQQQAPPGYPQPRQGGPPGGDPMNIFGANGPFNGGDPSVNGGALNQALSGGNTPQQHGYGIGDSTGFQPHSVGPGMTQAQPGSYNASFDMSGPGAAESYYASVMGKGPGTSVSANLDPYYERARERTGADVNKQLAARGQFGSSTGMGMLGDALGGLSAEQANREADYGLRRSQNELGWLGGMGGLAGQAQNAQQRRIGDLFGYQTALGDRASGQYFDQMNKLLGDDQNAMQAAMLSEMGLADQALQQGYRTPARILDESKQGAGILGGLLGGILGG